MVLAVRKYARTLRQLMPPGRILPRALDSTLAKLCEGLADEFERVDCKADRILREADPRLTHELLPDWERLLGLPDDCAGPQVGLAARRAAILGRLLDGGSPSRAFFAELAAAFGHPVILIEEHRPAIFGIAHCGAARCGGGAIRFWWTVHLPALEVVFPRVGACRFGDTRLGTYPSAAALECAFRRAAPAHSLVTFAYDLTGLPPIGGSATVILLNGDGLSGAWIVENGQIEILTAGGLAGHWVAAGQGIAVYSQAGQLLGYWSLTT